jgi:hypothetical protein
MINNKYPTTKPSLNLDFANTKSLDPRINFRRGTPGTYYDGVTHAKAEENLLSYSEDFSQWGFGRIVQTSGQSAPDGSSGAYKIEQAAGETTSGYLLQTYNTSANKSYTFSVYAKAGTNRNYVILRTFLSNNRFTYFDLANGEIANADDRHIASISDAGNGWYRCSITYTPISSSSVQFNVYFSDNDSSITVADDGGFIYLWGAQLEQRDTVTSYTATNGTPITKYQPKLMTAAADNARFDHDPITGESKGLLIEEQRTNLHRRSEDFVGGDDDSYQSTLISNSLIAPDGQLSATKVEYDPGATGGGYSNGYRPGTSSGQILTGSIYFKEGSLSKVNCFFNIRKSDLSSLTSYGVNVDLSQGSIVSQDTEITSSSIINAGNGWYRVSWSATMPAEAAKVGLSAYMYDTTISPSSYLDGFYIWGAQLEAGSFATSYIKTTGASATRSADNASITGENFSSWYRQDEGSFYSEIISAKNIINTNTGQCVLSIGDGSTSNILRLRRSTSNRTVGMIKRVNGSNTAFASSIASLADDTKGKLVGAYDLDNSYLALDGSSVLSASGASPLNLNKAIIGNSPFTNGDYLNGHIKKLAYYPQRLTNEQLQNLTK